MSTLKIKRLTSYTDSLRAYQILLDQKVIGKIRSGEEAVFDIEHGHHELRLEIDWKGSDTIAFEANNDAIEFECSSGVKFMDFLFPKPQDPWILLRRL